MHAQNVGQYNIQSPAIRLWVEVQYVIYRRTLPAELRISRNLIRDRQIILLAYIINLYKS